MGNAVTKVTSSHRIAARGHLVYALTFKCHNFQLPESECRVRARVCRLTLNTATDYISFFPQMNAVLYGTKIHN